MLLSSTCRFKYHFSRSQCVNVCQFACKKKVFWALCFPTPSQNWLLQYKWKNLYWTVNIFCQVQSCCKVLNNYNLCIYFCTYLTGILMLNFKLTKDFTWFNPTTPIQELKEGNISLIYMYYHKWYITWYTVVIINSIVQSTKEISFVTLVMLYPG